MNFFFIIFIFLSRPCYCSDRAGQVKLVTFHICHCFLAFQTQLNLMLFHVGTTCADLFSHLYFIFAIKFKPTFVAIFTLTPSCADFNTHRKITGSYQKKKKKKRRRKHLEEEDNCTIALTQNIAIYQNGIPYRTLKHIVKLSIKLNLYLIFIRMDYLLMSVPL